MRFFVIPTYLQIPAAIEAFAATSERTGKIETVEMVNCNIVDKEAEAWAEVMKANRTITSLNLESNSIATAGIEAIRFFVNLEQHAYNRFPAVDFLRAI